jgi:hypothetical protein
MAKMKTEDQLLWKENAPILVQRSDREEQKRKWSISLWMGIWSYVLLDGYAVVSREELVAKKYVYGQTRDGRSSIEAT